MSDRGEPGPGGIELAGALEQCGCLTGTLSTAMPVPPALLSLGAGIVAVALAALIDALIRAGNLAVK